MNNFFEFTLTLVCCCLKNKRIQQFKKTRVETSKQFDSICDFDQTMSGLSKQRINKLISYKCVKNR